VQLDGCPATPEQGISERTGLSGYGDDDTEDVVTWPAHDIAMVEDSRIAHVSVEWVCRDVTPFRTGHEAAEPRSYP
jgi:hypothetical protein